MVTGPEVGLKLQHLPRQLSARDGATLRTISLRGIGVSTQAVAALARAALLPGAATAGAFLLAYIGLEWVSFIHEYKGVPVTPWNPGLGVLFALLILKGAGYGLVLLAGVVVAETLVLRTELAWPVILALAVLVSASYAAAAAIARRRLALDVGLRHVRDVLVLLAAGGIGAAVSAVLVSVLLLAADELTLGDLTGASLPLFVGDLIGIAVMTPLLLRLYQWRSDVTRETLVRLVPEALLLALVTGFALWMIVASDRPNDSKYVCLLFLPVVAAAVRHGVDGSCLALAGTQLGLVALVHRYGTDATAFTELQLVMLVLTTTGLLVGVVVSERRQADRAARVAEARLQDMQAEAARAARLNMVSGMASALAHEINQPMTAARALARSAQQILRGPNADMARVDGNLATLVTQVDHAAGVVRRMREFLRRGQPHFSTLDVGVVLEEALVLARPDAAAHATRIDLEIAPSLPSVFGDRIQLQQVVLNLVRNGVDSIAESGRPDGHIRIQARLADGGGSVEVGVADNGIGIPPDRTLFEPLQSTKKEGLGLGLSISASIMQAHEGRIWLAAGAPGATELRLSLPVRTQGAA